jgi:hypothetical protein
MMGRWKWNAQQIAFASAYGKYWRRRDVGRGEKGGREKRRIVQR